jgi:hypothetical protein
MRDWSTDFMAHDGQLFRRSFGEIIAELMKARFPRDTTKHIERRYDVEPSTARNVRRGHVSNQSITSILYGEGEDVFALLDALGEALTGVTRDQWEEAKVNKIIREAELAQQTHRLVRLRRQLLAENADEATEADDRAIESASRSAPRGGVRRHA